MKHLARLNRAQRMVLVVGLGVIIWSTGIWFGTLGSHGNFGWVAYAPLSDATSPPGLGLAHGSSMLISIGMVVLWVGASFVIFGVKERETSGE